MNRTEFKEKVVEVLGASSIKGNKISVDWSTGGYSGGNCWDSTEAQPYTSSSPEPEFEELDSILEAVCPNISFINYKTVVAKLIKTSSRFEREYYGNSTNYAIKTVDLDELFDSLKEKGLI